MNQKYYYLVIIACLIVTGFALWYVTNGKLNEAFEIAKNVPAEATSSCFPKPPVLDNDDPDTWVDKSRVEDVKRTQEYVVIITGGRSCAVKRTTEGCWSSIDAVGATETLILVDGINGIITVYPKRVRKEYGLPHNPKVVISEEK